MITAAKLTRTALELGVPADVFSETAANLRALETKISLAFNRDFDSVDGAIQATQHLLARLRAEAYEKFRAEHIQALLED